MPNDTITKYIQSKPEFKLMPFMTIYTAIQELIKDGYITKESFEIKNDV